MSSLSHQKIDTSENKYESLLSIIESLTLQISDLKTKIHQVSIMKANKNEIITPEKAHHFEAIITNSYTNDISLGIWSEVEYQFATANQPLRFITGGSSTLDFTSGDPYNFFIPPTKGYYRVALIIHGCDTYSRINDPLLIYLNEYELDENNQESQTNLSILMTGIYQQGPIVDDPIIAPTTLNFNKSFIQTYYGEHTLRLDSTKIYKLFMKANTNNSIGSESSQVTTMGTLLSNQYTVEQIDNSIRQLFFPLGLSKLFVNYLGPTHPI